VSSVGWTIGTGGPGGTPALFALPELALLPELFLLELVLLELLLAELLALREPLVRPADGAGAPDEGPAALSLELFVVPVAPVVDVVPVEPVEDVVAVVDEAAFPFCAQGGRFGSSCARMGSCAADASRNAPSSGRKCHILRWGAQSRRWAVAIGD